MRPSAGQFSNRGKIQSKQESRSASGQVISTWVDVADVWFAKLREVSRETSAAREVIPEATTTLMIRYRTDVTVLMRFLWGSRVYDILGVRDPDGRREVLMLDCKEGRSQGS